MIKAYYLENEKTCYRFFYESNNFYHAVTVDNEHPYKSPSRQNQHIAYAPDFGNSFHEWVNLHSSEYNPGVQIKLLETKHKPCYYAPRIWKGNIQYLDALKLAGSQSVLSKSIIAVRLIIERLFEIFSYVEPYIQNNSVFGHKLRDVILLSCMEIESSWTSILTANNYAYKRFTTKDYVKLLSPLALSHYEVEFPMYPEIGIVTPFKNWDEEKPTHSLAWYDAYNKTKHNREDNFKIANLKNAIESVCAVAFMLCAQFGPESVPKEIRVTLNYLDPKWPYIPLRQVTRSINPNGTTQGIGYNDSSSWSIEKYNF